MNNPFRGIVKADELSPELATKLFIPQASPIWAELQRPLNQIVVGPRGAGKTIALKQLDHKGTSLPGTQTQFIGVYIQISRICTVFGNLFPRTGNIENHLPTGHFQQVFADYIWLEIIREIHAFLQLHLNEFTTTAATIRSVTGIDARSLDELDEYCSEKQLAIETKIQSWTINKTCSWDPIADLASSVQRCAIALRRLIPNLSADRPSLYLLFDESSPIPTECQEVLNTLLHRGRPYCVKLAVRPFEWQTLRTHKGAQIELDTDVVPLYVHYSNELEDDYVSHMRSVANKVLNTHRSDLDQDSDDLPPMLDIQDVLPHDPQVEYSGFRQVCAASSGNPQNLLLICSSIFAAVGPSPRFSNATRIPPATQHQVINMWSKDYEDRNPYGDSRSFCRGLLKLIRDSDTKSIGFRYEHTDRDLFTPDYLPDPVGNKIKSAFSGGFLRSTHPSDRSLFEVPAHFHISRGLLPREGLNLRIPILPETVVDERFVHQFTREGGPRPSTASTTPETITAFLSTSFSPLMTQQRADIKASLEHVGIVCRDVGDHTKHQFLFSDIYKLMRGSDITLLDATVLRPYTMFEIGLSAGAHKPKPVICIINDNDSDHAIANLHESLQKLPVLTFSFSQTRLTKLASEVFTRATELIANKSEFQIIALTNVPLRPRHRDNKTAYVSFPGGPQRDRAVQAIKTRLERDGWKTITEDDAQSYAANELQIAIQCAYTAGVGIIDTSGTDRPDLLQCFKLGLFPGKRHWRVLQTEERQRARPDVFNSVPGVSYAAWTTFDELAEHVATFVTTPGTRSR